MLRAIFDTLSSTSPSRITSPLSNGHRCIVAFGLAFVTHNDWSDPAYSPLLNGDVVITCTSNGHEAILCKLAIESWSTVLGKLVTVAWASSSKYDLHDIALRWDRMHSRWTYGIVCNLTAALERDVVGSDAVAYFAPLAQYAQTSVGFPGIKVRPIVVMLAPDSAMRRTLTRHCALPDTASVYLWFEHMHETECTIVHVGIDIMHWRCTQFHPSWLHEARIKCLPPPATMRWFELDPGDARNDYRATTQAIANYVRHAALPRAFLRAAIELPAAGLLSSECRAHDLLPFNSMRTTFEQAFCGASPQIRALPRLPLGWYAMAYCMGSLLVNVNCDTRIQRKIVVHVWLEGPSASVSGAIEACRSAPFRALHSDGAKSVMISRVPLKSPCNSSFGICEHIDTTASDVRTNLSVPLEWGVNVRRRYFDVCLVLMQLAVLLPPYVVKRFISYAEPWQLRCLPRKDRVRYIQSVRDSVVRIYMQRDTCSESAAKAMRTSNRIHY